VIGSLRNRFFRTHLDTVATDFTEFHGQIHKNPLFSVVSAKSVYRTEVGNGLRNSL